MDDISLPDKNRRIGEIIDSFCEGKQSVLADKLKIKPQYVSKLFTLDKRSNPWHYPIPTDKFLENILTIFPNVNRIWLLTGEGERFKTETKTNNNMQDKPPPETEVSTSNIPKTSLEAIFQLIANNTTSIDTTARLTKMLEAKEATVNDAQQMLQAVITKQNVFQEYVIATFARKFPDLNIQEEKVTLDNKLAEKVGANS